MHRTPMETEWLGQGQPPRIMNRLRDIRKLVRGSTRRFLSRRSGRLASRASASDSSRSAILVGALDQLGVGPARQLDLAPVDDLVGEQQRGEQQLARFGQACRARRALPCSWHRPAPRRRADCPPRRCGRRRDNARPAMVSSTSAISAPRRAAGGANQVVELGDDAGDLAAQRVVAAAVHRPALDRALDAQQGAFGAVKGLVEGRSGSLPTRLGILKPLAKPPPVGCPRLTLPGPATIGTRPSASRISIAAAPVENSCQRNADSPTPSAPWRWMRSKPPIRAIRACRWAWPTPRRRLFTRHLKHDPSRSATGPTATASCCRRGMARC